MKLCWMFFLCFWTSISLAQDIQDTVLVKELDGIQFNAKKPYSNKSVSLSRSQFLTMSGALEDPSRLLIKFPGISTVNDQANAIVYHGMPSQYHRWSLYGARILNPNHLGNAGTISDLPSRSAGGVNMLSGQVIGSLDFYGNPSPKSMDALGGSSDIKLRKQYTNSISTNLSLIGLEAGIDRVFDDGNSGLMVNYRYSTVGLLTSMGLDFGGEEINYQDLTAAYNKKTETGEWNYYLSLGANSNNKASIDSDSIPETFKDFQRINFDNKVVLAGINFMNTSLKNISSNTTINFSHRNTNRIVDQEIFDDLSIYSNQESLIAFHRDYAYRNLKSNEETRWSIGYDLDFYSHFIDLNLANRTNVLTSPSRRGEKSTHYHLIPRVKIGYELPKDWMVDASIGVHGVAGEQEKLTLVGNVEFTYDYNDLTGKISLSRSGQLMDPEFGFYIEELDFITNTNIEMQAAYKGWGGSLFYHKINDIPYSSELFAFSGISELDNLPQTKKGFDFDFDGVAEIYGASFFMYKTISKFKLSANVTLTNSSYAAGSTDSKMPFDYGHIMNATVNREWRINKTKKFGLSASFHLRGGARQNTVSSDGSLFWGYTNYEHTDQFNLQLTDYYRADLRIYYSPSTKSTISLDIQNVTNRENDGYYFYEPLTQESTLKRQLGMIPILSWRKTW